MKSSYRLVAVVLLLLNVSLAEASKKNPMAPSSLPVTLCRNIYYAIRYGTFYKPQKPPEDKPLHLVSDHDILAAQREEQKVGKFANVFDPRFDTRVYYTATGRPDAEGKMPVVDPEAKALYIYLHGSGTDKASGVNFATKANALAKLGYAVVSFDLPFHKEGTKNAKLADIEKFNEYLDNLIKAYRVEGQPVILAGHSFGPGLIGEYIRSKPFGVDGAVLISPASYTPELEKYFEQVTSMANRFWGDTKPNEIGAHWAGVVSDGHRWAKPHTEKWPDPTIVNPKLKVRVMSGDQDEYFPGNLDSYGEPTKEARTYDFRPDFQKFLRNAVLTREPGVGHYIFTHTDANGHDVVMRELLAANGESLDNKKEMEKAFNGRQFSSTETALMRFSREPIFKTWVESQRGGEEALIKAHKENDQKTSQAIIKDFQKAYDQRIAAIYENIKRTDRWAPKFYATHKDQIEKIGAKGVDSTPLLKRYFDLLDEQGLIQRARIGSASEDTMKIEPSTEVAEEPKAGRPANISPEMIAAQRERKEKQLREKEEKKRLAQEKAQQNKAVGE